MISEAFVWIWLPTAKHPVVCGKLILSDQDLLFVYGRSYLDREDAISLDPRELPLTDRIFQPNVGGIHGVIRDASPDAWGRRVLLYCFGSKEFTELEYLIHTGQDRIGALDIQLQPNQYIPEESVPILEDLASAADYIDGGKTLPPDLNYALHHASSVGGARPKALLTHQNQKYIAKFSSSTDHYPVIKSEYAAMWLAGKCGMDVADVKLTQVMGKDVLLVKRFDRIECEDFWQRRLLISGLTALQLHETEGSLASYLDLAGFIRRYSDKAMEDLYELFMRMVFNILIGNNDDHARNHAFYWDGKYYKLTPAYDICPMLRSGQISSQAMTVGQEGRLGTIKNALSEAGQFGLTLEEAKKITKDIEEKIRGLWPEAVKRSLLTKQDSEILRKSTILSPACFY